VALAESCFRHETGAELTLEETSVPAEIALFGEQDSRVVVSCDPRKRDNINELAASRAISSEFLGTTGGARFELRRGASTLVSAYTRDLKNVWAGALESALHSDVPDHLVPEILDK